VIRHVTATLAVALLAVGCSHGRPQKSDKFVTAAQRMRALRRAQVWAPTDVASMDISAGPQGSTAFPPGATVDCRYVDEKLGGRTPKFACKMGDDDQLKVRYGRDNGEVYAGVAATRLLWALGYGADPTYPVHVVCHGCPATIPGDRPSSGGATYFDVAAIERKFPGKDIGSAPDQGWAWPELDLVDEHEGGAPREQRDGLKLLAVFLQHTDSKADQQRLVCLGDKKSARADADCAEPFLLVHDVGQTFGSANLLNRSSVGSVNLDRWTHTAVWRDATHCIGDLAQSETGTLVHPQISEAGRAFLSALLDQLGDNQIRDLFLVARFTDRTDSGGPGPSTVERWVDTFKHKRDEIRGAHCPS
jgi:hypothetical protein